MRIDIRCLAAVLAVVGLSEPAFSQTKKPAPKTGGSAEAVRYFQLNDLFGDLAGDVFLKETRQGTRVVSALLDACIPVAQGSPRKDRFAVALRPDGPKLVGSGETTEAKLPVSVNLTRRGAGTTFSFEGTVTRGSDTMEVSSSDNGDMSETEFREARSETADPVADPPDFTELSPYYVALKFRRNALADVLDWLRGQKVKVDFRSIRPNCDELRSGQQVVNVQIDPERAADFIARSRSAPGIVSAGWTAGDYAIDNALRFGAAEWRDGQGVLMREKLAPAISEALEQALSAKAQSSEWNEVTGELTLKFKRPSQLVPGLNFTETVESTVLVSPEKPGSRERLILWIADPQLRTSDDSGNPLLLGLNSDKDDEEHDLSPETARMVAAAADRLKGERWDSESSAWQ
jgi:hypothetical protein